jgi:hypothetical protein
LAEKQRYSESPILITDILSNHATEILTPHLPSQTKKGLWTTSSVPIKKMKEVFYETEGLPYDTFVKNGQDVYVENPISNARANIILKKSTKASKVNDFINIQNPLKNNN